MSYSPNNLCVYVAAVAGYNAGLIAARNQPTDPNENDYVDGAERADFFGQAVDQVWGITSYTNADLQQIENAATALLASGRSIVQGAAGLTQAGYSQTAVALVAGVRAGTQQIVAEGVNPNGCGGGGGGTVTSVTGSVPIVITGLAASPNVTITAATDVAAGSMSATDKTKLDNITTNAPTNVFQAFFAATGAVATSQSFATAAPVTVGPSGRLTWTVTVVASANQSGGGTSVAGELLAANATLDGVNQAGIDALLELSVTHAVVGIVLTATVGGLVPGATHTPGIKITNSTTPTHTFSMQDGQLTGYT